MEPLQVAELLSYVVTILGLPVAIFLFAFEQRKARANGEDEIYERLTSSYAEFLTLAIANPDLRLRSTTPTPNLTDEQAERLFAMLELLIALFERAYLLTYDEGLTGRRLRQWRSWEDFMREWCRREDFRSRLPQLLVGEDAEFAAMMRRLAAEEGEPAPA